MANDVINFAKGSQVDAYWCGKWWPNATVNKQVGDKFHVTWDDGTVSLADDIRKPRKTYTARPLRGEVVVFTGALETLTRRRAEARARRAGATVSKAVSATTTLVVVGADAGKKLDRATALGLKTISERKFLKLAA